MRRPASNGLVLALLAVAVLFVLSRTRQGQSAIAGATDSLVSAVRGLRLNNPLNVERGEPWQGLASTQPDARFAAFVSVPYGIRAAQKILMTYRAAYGIATVRKIIDRWNPKADGQPDDYIPDVAGDLGVSPDTPIDVRSRGTAFALHRSMMRKEIGAAAALLVSDQQIHDGLTLAGVA